MMKTKDGKRDHRDNPAGPYAKVLGIQWQYGVTRPETWLGGVAWRGLKHYAEFA
jgi:hypothetical protein